MVLRTSRVFARVPAGESWAASPAGMDSVRSDDSLASSSGSSENDLNRVPVPRHVLDALRATIVGPLGDPSPTNWLERIERAREASYFCTFPRKLQLATSPWS